MYAVDVTLSAQSMKRLSHTSLSLCNRKLKNLLFCFVDYNQIEGLRVSLESLSANPEKAELLAFQGQANLPMLLIHAVDLKRIEIIEMLEHRAPSYSRIGGVILLL